MTERDPAAAHQHAETLRAQHRAAFLAFVRDHHPDRGGDPEAFIAGLARLRAAESVRATEPVDPQDVELDPRFDAPVEVVTPPAFPVRVGVALIRTWHRHRRRRVE
jgi:hypothetical protein